MVLNEKVKLLGSKLKVRTSKTAFSEVLLVPYTGGPRQAQIRVLNAWMRKWGQEAEFRQVKHWGIFLDKLKLYRREGFTGNQTVGN